MFQLLRRNWYKAQVCLRGTKISHTTNSILMSSESPNDTKRPSSAILVNPPKQKKQKLKRYKQKKVDVTSPLGILQLEIDELLKENSLARENVCNDIKTILNDKTNEIRDKYHREVSNVKVQKLTSNGDGLALIDNPVETTKKQIVIIPFGLPGDLVNVKVFKTHPYYVESDLLDVLENSPLRHNELIRDKYFGKYSGSQFEFLTYEDQLKIKQTTVANAYKFFAPRLVSEGLLPEIGTTVASPLKYNYRTKITPHFDMPRRATTLEVRPPLGFGQKGRPKWRKETLEVGGTAPILDIDRCELATDILNIGLTNERRKFDVEFKKYKKGATILLRENTVILDPKVPTEEQLGEGSRDINGKVSYIEVADEEHGVALAKTCVTNSTQIVTEYVDGYVFNFSAGEFFQNNDSILPIVTKYVRDNLQIPNSSSHDPNYLVDAYCGSGLFSVCSSKGVTKVIGVEISADSVSFAEKNAKANNVENCRFIVGKAEKLFESIDIPSDRTSVILDPPRKGCDEIFMKQLSEFHPARIVYISCNVHSQARDLEYFLKETENGKDYKVESLRGFDFFPQTHHVESVCVLSRV
ncbi:tRNA (uracil(54)-C(5))-methyltransferase KNAG_0C01250 [Huiozyma naganishii CBS 8797]|uniref:tRNA (uracil(54)-C(5))-methyltransferase n=1 Tax=Huiozyma naganishii (strain ATCC MYA-139 / BCRC 22969 / CBS 8797 / KCTC 17520 / NBRC 10181 / NCYC 3082 / Yp74L-3) TaxID=1071383 RepID=J7RI74_HUIN7|nr:hypothetical protein KNAG_0C01250 [Kazachstania naganishii CBS 8797]CCK69238.1 hypothetical protein KNAG_0C01250 [Kazachstania naganishii CBS 8797]